MGEKGIFDVVVVGAGPSGSVAAKTAAEQGLDVLMVEKHHGIGIPVQCAEGISEEGLEILKALLGEKAVPRWVAKQAKIAEIITPDGTTITVDRKGYVLERRILDKDLAISALRAGAEIVKGTAVGFTRNKEADCVVVRVVSSGHDYSFPAKIVIGADGPESRIGKCAGVDTKLNPSDKILGQQYLVYSPELEDLDRVRCFLGPKIAPGGGYAWIFSKGNSTANVGIGMFEDKLKEFDISVPDYFLNGFVGRVFKEYQIIEKTAGIIPGAPPSDIVADDVMLAGDAAGAVNYISGGGLRTGMESGKIAGEIAAAAISKGDTSKKGLADYRRRIFVAFGKDNEQFLTMRRFSQTLTDKDYNDLGHSLKDVNFSSEASAISLVTTLLFSNPGIAARFAVFKVKNKL
ncbi:NAD(P)/FAD-dependent oxidoreductase [Candidatus Parcubacteria bacterium]|nr:NAD(P)/FAD-dependent oxidoreductase [Candidatus Parcubacteria bacterium]